MAKLETASDISGEEGASQIARLLQLTDGGVQNIKAFGDEIVKLGNNFPATESEILANATRIAQSTGIYKLGRQEILAYATATKSVGVEAELVGSSLGRTLGILEGAIRTGKGLSTVLKLVGGTQAELSARFRQDASGVLMDFISGLNRTGTAAEDFNKNLSSVGITAQRDRDVIGSLASKGYAVLAEAMDQVKDATGSMDAEFGTAAEKLVNQTQRIGIAWDNFVLGIENGQGRIGKASVAVIGFIADIIDGMSSSALASDKLVDSYYKLENQTKYTEDAVRPLLKRYDELKSKTNLNKEEHTELRDIIQRVAALIPSAITEFNKYGEVIDINKSKITQFNEAQKQLVRDMNISTRKSLGEELSELKRQRDQLVSVQNNSVQGRRGTSFVSRLFSIGLDEDDRLKGIQERTEKIAILTDKIKTNLQRQRDLGGTLGSDDEKFLERFEGQAQKSAENTGKRQEEAVKKNKEYWEKIVSETQEALNSMELAEKGSDTWNNLTKKLVEAQQNVDKYSLSKGAAAARSSERIYEKSRQATERQRALQLEIDKINEAASRNQLSRDESEVASVKDKYAKIKEEVRKFYADPKNKGLRVDMSGLQRSENFEISEATTRQGTKQLAESLTVQKQLLDEYNAYAERTSKEEADKRYAGQLASFKGYKERLQKEYMDLITLEKTSALGGFTGSSVKLTQAQEERAKVLRQLLDALDKEERERENNRFVEALKLASDYDAQLIEVQKKYQQALVALGNDATEERKAQLKKGLLEETSAIVSANIRQKVEWDKTFSTLQFMSKKATDSVLDDIQKRVDAEYKAGKLTKQEYDQMSREIGAAKVENNLAKSWIASTGALERYRATVKKYGKDSIEAKQAQSEMFTALADDLAKAQHIVGLLGDSLSQLGIGGDGLQNTINQIGNLVGGMGELAAGIASGNPISIISGSIKTLTSALDLFNTKDKKLQKQIDAYRNQLDSLGKAYDTLQRRISNSVGENYYSDSDKAIANLREQQRILAEMARAEEDKKKTDKEKVRGYYDEIDSINKQIEDIQKAITENLVQTTFKDLSASLADALVSAFEAGESAVDSLDETFDKFIKNALVNSLKLKMIEPIVNDMVNQLAEYMKSNNNSLTGFNFSVWKDKIDGAGEDFTKTLEEAYKQLGLEKDGTSTGGGLKGSIQRELTESTASELTGLYRASFELQKKAFDESKSQGISMGKQLLVAMDQLTALNAIQVNTAETVKRLDTAVGHLSTLVKNTSPQSNRAYGG